MSTKTIGGWQKVGIELGSYVFHPNSSQPGMFQTFALIGNLSAKYKKKVFMVGPAYIIDKKYIIKKTCVKKKPSKF